MSKRKDGKPRVVPTSRIPVRFTIEIEDKKYGASFDMVRPGLFNSDAASVVTSLANQIGTLAANTVMTHFEAKRDQ